MPGEPRFSYFLSHLKNPVTEDTPIWQESIPLKRKHSQKTAGISVSHGDYFLAARSFLENNRYEIITGASAQCLRQDVKPEDIAEIRICLVKHGEFYHPARIEALVDRHKISFVLNVAISDAGISFIKKEYRHLKKLNTSFPFSYLPQVYGQSAVDSKSLRETRMFLGQWFEGFYEFHVSKDKSDEKNKIAVWDDEHGGFFLSAGQTIKLYTQASKILTCYYNLESFEQIFPWHHAAGDFVIRVENDKLELRLITVRQYASIFKTSYGLKNTEEDAELILQALLIFFLNLSIRMRLDRLDGIGEIVWSDNIAVYSTLAGFFEGLTLKPDVPSLPESPALCFKSYLSACTQADLYDLAQAILNTINPKTSEFPVVKQHLKEHVETLCWAVNHMLNE